MVAMQPDVRYSEPTFISILRWCLRGLFPGRYPARPACLTTDLPPSRAFTFIQTANMAMTCRRLPQTTTRTRAGGAGAAVRLPRAHTRTTIGRMSDELRRLLLVGDALWVIPIPAPTDGGGLAVCAGEPAPPTAHTYYAPW